MNIRKHSLFPLISAVIGTLITIPFFDEHSIAIRIGAGIAVFLIVLYMADEERRNSL